MMPSAQLPEIDDVTRARVEQMIDYLRERIAANGGWLSLCDYINIALYAPGRGYYVNGARKFSDPADPCCGGDFITAPELTPLFAQTWAKAFAGTLKDSPCILELGGGSGRFAADVLTALAQLGQLPERYAILERSAELRQRQQQTLARYAPQHAGRVVWLDTLPDTLSGIVFLNEVLDAIAPEILIRENGQWQQQGVVADATGLQLAKRLCTQTRLLALAEERAPLAVDCVVELNCAAEALVETLARALSASGQPGVLYLSDYGFERTGRLPEPYKEGTLRAFYRHRLIDDVLYLPGEMDLTTSIDFVAMLEAAQRGGLQLSAFATQQQWLLRYGITDCIEAALQQEPQNRLTTTRAVNQLLNRDEMGEVFKVLEVQVSGYQGSGIRNQESGIRKSTACNSVLITTQHT